MEENKVHIVEWPQQQHLTMDHDFPSGVKLDHSDWPKMPLLVNMHHNGGETIPICVKFCDPVCAESSYKIGINLMGQPFAEIAIRGITKLFNCASEGDSEPITKDDKFSKDNK